MLEDLDHEIRQFEAEISQNHNVDDPLEAYDQYIRWAKERLPSTTFLELLEQSIRTFKDDAGYKSDPRYFNMWLLFAARVFEPNAIFAYMLAHDIGTVFSKFYQTYAESLESAGL